MAAPHLTLTDAYKAYLAALNARPTVGPLTAHLHPLVLRNAAPLDTASYHVLIQSDVDAIPGLLFEPDMLLEQPSTNPGDPPGSGTIAAKLTFRRTPKGGEELIGVRVPDGWGGREVVYTEHVFYWYEEWKIKQVWSLLDSDGLRMQLAKGSE